MPAFSFEGRSPTVHPGAFVAPTATLVGEVVIEDGASVWYNAVLRADYSPVIVRAGANGQDGSILHGPPDMPCDIGKAATVAHLCVVHGAPVGEEALIATASTVPVRARLGARTIHVAPPLVPARAESPDAVP